MFDFEFARTTLLAILRDGLPKTVLILVGTVFISMPLGFLVGLVRYREVPVISQILKVVISFFRGTPLIILIFLLYSALPDAVNSFVRAHGWKVDVYGIMVGNVMLCAIGICSTFTTATMSEIFRSALSAVNGGQLEAAHSVGLSTLQAYLHVIIPQALVSAIPNLGNNIVGLTKGTSLLFFMAISDIMGTAKTYAGRTYMYVEAYVDVLIVYVVFCFLLQRFFMRLERRMSRYLRPLQAA